MEEKEYDKGIEKLLKSLKYKDDIMKISNDELIDLLKEHILYDLPIISSQFVLLEEAVYRLSPEKFKKEMEELDRMEEEGEF